MNINRLFEINTGNKIIIIINECSLYIIAFNNTKNFSFKKELTNLLELSSILNVLDRGVEIK